MAGSQHKGVSNFIVSMTDKDELEQRVVNRRSAQQITAKLFKKSREGRHESVWDNPMKSVRIYCNFARDRVVMLDSLILHFDAEGYAEMPEHKLPMLEAEMRVKPGRYKIVAEVEPEKKVVAPEVTEQVKDLLSTLKASEEAGDEVTKEVKEKASKPETRRPSRRSRKKKEKE